MLVVKFSEDVKIWLFEARIRIQLELAVHHIVAEMFQRWMKSRFFFWKLDFVQVGINNCDNPCDSVASSSSYGKSTESNFEIYRKFLHMLFAHLNFTLLFPFILSNAGTFKMFKYRILPNKSFYVYMSGPLSYSSYQSKLFSILFT